MASDGSDVRTVVRRTRPLAWPSWSPDGSKIVYTALVGPSQQFDLFSVDSDGTERIRLTDTPRRDEAWPIFSPDGSSIVYTRSRDYRDDPSDLFAMALDGSRVRRLTDTPKVYEETRSFQPIP
jgi:Tol biopolymer transport system component